MKKIVALLLVFSLLLTFGGCRKSTPKDPDATSGNDASSVQIEDADFEDVTVITGKLLSVGDTYSFARMWEISGYRSAKPAIASVDEDGMITAVSEGTTMVMAKSGTDEKSSAIIICVLPKGETAEEVPLQIHSADTYYPLATVIADPEYASSNESVVTVSEDGLLRFFAPGYAVITVTGKEGTEQHGYIVYDRSLEK